MKKGSNKKTKKDLLDSHRHPVLGDDEGFPAAHSAISHDISRPDKMLEALQESESILRSFFDSSGVMRGIVEMIAEDDLRFITINAATAAFSGLTPDAMRNKTASELGIPHEILRMWVGHFIESQKNQKPVTFEYRDKRGDTESWLLVTANYLGTHPHGYPRFAYVVLDITGRKLAEEALRESEERHRLLAETMLQGVVHQNADGTIISMNPAAEQILGKTRKEFLGETSESVEHHTIREDGSFFPGLEHPAMVALRTGKQVRRVIMGVFNPREKTYRWISIDAVPLFRPGEDRPFQVYTVFEDITDRKQTEAALRENEQRLQLSLDVSRIGTWDLDLVRHTAHRSLRHDQIFGYEDLLTEWTYEMFLDHVTPEDRQDVDRKFQDAIQNKRDWNFECRIHRKDGVIRWIHARGRGGYNNDGKPVRMIGIVQDITDRRQAEKALRESEEKYRGLFENVQESVAIYRLVFDENGKAFDRIFVDANPKSIREMGYRKREEVIGKPYSEVVLRHFPGDQKSIDKHLESLAEVARSGTPLTYDTHFGDRFYITTQYPIGRDLVASSSIEITSHKQGEKALRESEVQLRRAQDLLDSITKSTGVMIASEDTEFRYTYFNKAYADEIRKLTGKELAVGMSMVDLFAHMPGEQKNSVIQWQKVLAGKSINQNISFKNPGREPRTFNVIHTPIRDDEGKIIGAGEVSYDVTRQIRTEEELLKTSRYLENLLDYANAPIIVWDKEFHITRFNRAFERLTGMTAGEVMGQTPKILIPEKNRPEAMNLIRRATTGDRWEVVEIPILHKNGDIRTVLWNSATLYEDDGKKIIATIAQGQDITERKQAEVAMKQSETRERAQLEELTKVLDAVPAAVWIANDRQALTITGNQLSHEWLRLPGGANMSKSAPEGIRPDTFRMFRNGKELSPEKMPVQVSAAGKEVRDFEFDFVYPDGGVRHVLGNATPLLDENGQPRGSVAAFIDITDRKNSEGLVLSEKKRAEETLSLLNAALESTAEGIYVVDTMRKITSVNQNFNALWNIPDDVRTTGDDRKVSRFLQAQVKDPKVFLERVLDLYKHPDRESFDMVELLDGRIFERHSKPQKMRDKIIGRVWSYRDVTDRRHAEEKLIASLQEKETLIREIHHRVKNNLQIISGLLDMTRMRTPDSTTHSILTDMMMKIKTMAQIHTRLYESKQFDKINMGNQIRDQVADLSSIYGRSGADIQSEIDAQDIYLPVDQAIPCALVVNEILSNAFKHAFRGKKHGTLMVSATQMDDHIRIIVTDDGVGIPKDVDVHRTASLGLKLIRSLVLQLNGSLSITSSHGTEVKMEFPLNSGGK